MKTLTDPDRSDGDLHVLISDPEAPSARMIVEIPDPREGANGFELHPVLAVELLD